MWEVKESIRIVFEGEGVVFPHRCALNLSVSYAMDVYCSPALQQIRQINFHSVAFPINGGDGLVQAFLQLPLDERIAAVDGHHKLLQHWTSRFHFLFFFGPFVGRHQQIDPLGQKTVSHAGVLK